ncbi:MAG: glutathione peroxidase [Marinomonas sp.]|jgi:glutathione peroxidase|uniref:Glutathione peroxidase n=1 Tax=Marinomonas pontica TaxID=264739 RepID=A0ABN6WMZ4_9GAMM|nr:glutathione peroxidase [Marinomonas pontica]MCW8357112.1 glutathione peroxidase [Marinomonas pontica]BDX03003.1 glutathione peroxidase [Marinomonas pontica]
MSHPLNLTVNNIQGKSVDLSAYQGKTVLVVNVASKCGLTPQYEGLEALYKKYHEQGLEILGFPANDFAGQEPGSDEDIQQFCSLTYDVTFPMFSKIVVTGEDKHPLYKNLIEAAPVTPNRDAMVNMLAGHKIEATKAPEVVWNFEKFLITKDGKVERFSPDVTPKDDALVASIEADL